VLLVDDIRTNLLVLEQMLQDIEEIQIITAMSGAEVFDLLDQHDFALILLDVFMPEINGFEISRRIREHEHAQGVPIILITGEDMSQEAQFEGYQSGAVDYLTKPIAPEILRSKVRIFCEIKNKEMIIRRQSIKIEGQRDELAREMEERRRVEEAQQESEMRYRTLVELSPEAIAVQVDDKIIYFNGTAMRLLAGPEEETLLGRAVHEFAHAEDRKRLLDYLQQVERQGGRGEPLEVVFNRFDGGTVPIEARAACIMFEGEIGVQVSLQDITERKRFEEQLRRLSQLDGLTGVANRRMFDSTIEREWRRTHRNQHVLSLIMLDIDSFKKYNDNYGHLAGDDCIKKVAAALERAVQRPGDFVARYGGEEFALLLPETPGDGAMHVAEHARSLVEEMRIEHKFSDGQPHITISLGVAAMVPPKDKKPDHLIAAADQAMYYAKKNGRNQVKCYGSDGGSGDQREKQQSG